MALFTIQIGLERDEHLLAFDRVLGLLNLMLEDEEIEDYTFTDSTYVRTGGKAVMIREAREVRTTDDNEDGFWDV